VAVSFAESSFLTHAISWTGCCVGLWQINLSVWGVTKEAMFDPYQNGIEAQHVYVVQGWDAWDAFGNARYNGYVSKAEACVQRQIACNNCALGTIPNYPDIGDVDPIEDPDTEDVSCNFSMFCWIKAGLEWAFVPSDSTQDAMVTFKDQLQSKPPFSVAYGVGTLAADVVEDIRFRWEASGPGDADGYDCVTLLIEELENPDVCFGESFVALANGHPIMVGAIRQGSLLLMWLGTMFLIFRILKATFSKTPEVEGGEIGKEEDVSEDNDSDR
jgi:hypothetical protein